EAAGCGQPESLCFVVKLTPGDAGLGTGGLALWIDTNAFHWREVDHQASIAGRVTRYIVAAAAYGDQQMVASGEIDRVNHVSDPGAASDNRGPAIDHRIVDLARRIVSIVSPKQMATAQSGTELLNHICVEHDLATCHRRDFDIRHIRSLPHVRNSASNGDRSPLAKTPVDTKRDEFRASLPMPPVLRARASHSAVEDVSVPA